MVDAVGEPDSLQYSEYKTLKVVRFGHGEQNRMVLSLGPAFYHSYGFAGVVGSLGDDLQEQSFIDVI
jgi:hypothetical protein